MTRAKPLSCAAPRCPNTVPRTSPPSLLPICHRHLRDLSPPTVDALAIALATKPHPTRPRTRRDGSPNPMNASTILAVSLARADLAVIPSQANLHRAAAVSARYLLNLTDPLHPLSTSDIPPRCTCTLSTRSADFQDPTCPWHRPA